MARSVEPPAIEAVLRGDAGALGRLLEAHQGRIFNVCLRMTGHRDDAAELTQESMLKIVEHIQSFHGQSEVSTWMVRIAMNLCISHLRKRKLRQTTSLDAAPGTAPGSSASAAHGDQSSALRENLVNHREPAPDSGVQQREVVAQLQAALAQIDDDFRAILVLRDVEGLDYQQIADVLALPVGTVKSRLFRARLSLRHEALKLFPPNSDGTGGPGGPGGPGAKAQTTNNGVAEKPNNMAERFDEELFLGYLEGDLTPEQIARFEKQLQEDAKLRNLVAQLVLDRHRLRNMPQQPAPPEVMERVNQRLERRMLLDAPPNGESPDTAPIRRFRLRQWLAYGAVAALVVVVGAFILHWLPGTGSTGAPTTALEAPARSPSAIGRGLAAKRRTEAANEPEQLAAAARPTDSTLPTLAGASPQGAESADGAATPQPGGRPRMPRPGARGKPMRPGKMMADTMGKPKFEDPIERALSAVMSPAFPNSRPMVAAQTDLSNALANATVPVFENLADDEGMTPAKGVSTPLSAGLGVLVHGTDAKQIAKAVQSWANENDVRVLDAQAAAAAVAAAGPPVLDKESRDAGAVDAQGPAMVLLMEQSQLVELISYLNLETSQSASQVALSGEAAGKGAAASGSMAKAAPLPAASAAPSGEANARSAAAPAAGPTAATLEAGAATQPASPDDGPKGEAGVGGAMMSPTAGSGGGSSSGRPILSPYTRVAVPIYIIPQQSDASSKGGK